MKNYACPKCGSVEVFIDKRGVQQALCCGDCGAWIKGIEFTVEENSKEKENNNGLEDTFQIRIYQYNGGKVGYYDVDKKAIPKILDIIEKHKKI